VYGEWAPAIPLAVRRDDSLVPFALFCEDVLQQFGSRLGGPILRNRLWFFCGLRAANPEQYMADLILEMSAALNSGHMRALESRSEQNTTLTSYETFVNEEFVPLYRRASAAA